MAVLEGRSYVTPDDIKILAHDVLRHRIGRSFEAIGQKVSVDDIITEIISSITVL